MIRPWMGFSFKSCLYLCLVYASPSSVILMLRRPLKLMISSALRRPSNARFISGKAGTSSRTNWTRRAVAGATLVAASALTTTIYADSNVDLEARPTLGSQVRAYLVYSMCSIPALVDASPKLLSMTSAVPGLKQITEAFVRVTFFNQVCHLRGLLRIG